MAKCIQCSSYTKFEGGLCYECYNEKKMVPNRLLAYLIRHMLIAIQ